ncbi:MAG: 23S rRNA (adenine(2503)-C(2))-methyltransferase RlmN [Clostridia bacterium]|nr:23S rRNA (adenine(2503)-C(2))-methyltransferase RlmN [Clostridia bacterium]
MGKNTKIDLLSMPFDKLLDYCAERGLKKFRATQIFDRLHVKRNTDFNEFTELSKEFREKLEKECKITKLESVRVQKSQKDQTTKLLFRLEDGYTVESVILKYKYGYTICLSTQVGCRMNCAFCLTGKDKFERNLTAGEILSQIYKAEEKLNINITRLVLMGMGEPLDNTDNVLDFIKIVSDHRGKNLGQRNISLSTCGIVPEIMRMAEENIPFNLDISLHASNNEIRNQIMPINKKYNIEDLISAAEYFKKTTGRRVTIVYLLIGNVNDSDKNAKELVDLIKGKKFHVNLIQFNENENLNFKKSKNLHKFAEILLENGITVTTRRTLGEDIDAACGLLRRSFNEETVY